MVVAELGTSENETYSMRCVRCVVVYGREAGHMKLGREVEVCGWRSDFHG